MGASEAATLQGRGLVHLYWGEGKGKTTAAVGQAVRAVGSGLQVVFVQFLKERPSGEVEVLRGLGVPVLRGGSFGKFSFQMTPEERAQARENYTAHLRRALGLVNEGRCDMLVLDEAAAAWQMDMVDKRLLQDAVLARPPRLEVVLTGRHPADWMRQAADYSTEMQCHRHPYEKGIPARRGVEF